MRKWTTAIDKELVHRKLSLLGFIRISAKTTAKKKLPRTAKKEPRKTAAHYKALESGKHIDCTPISKSRNKGYQVNEAI